MRVRDIVRKDYKIASVKQTVSSALDKAGHAEWVVIKQARNLPVGIIETDRLDDFHGNRLLINVVPSLSPLIVVPADLEIERAVQYPLLLDLPSGDAFGALVMDDNRVYGIWPKSDVAKTLMMFGATGGSAGGMSGNTSDPILGGEIGIEPPTVVCSFVDTRRVCPATATQAFDNTEMEEILKVLHRKKISQALLCPNPLKLKPHRFGERS